MYRKKLLYSYHRVLYHLPHPNILPPSNINPPTKNKMPPLPTTPLLFRPLSTRLLTPLLSTSSLHLPSFHSPNPPPRPSPFQPLQPLQHLQSRHSSSTPNPTKEKKPIPQKDVPLEIRQWTFEEVSSFVLFVCLCVWGGGGDRRENIAELKSIRKKNRSAPSPTPSRQIPPNQP